MNEGNANLRIFRPVLQAWPCKPESLALSPSTLLCCVIRKRKEEEEEEEVCDLCEWRRRRVQARKKGM